MSNMLHLSRASGTSRKAFFLAAASAFSLAGLLQAQPLPLTDLGLLPGDLAIAPAVNSQQDFAAAKGGEQYLVAWSDYRARSINSQTIQSDGDIFGIRVDQAGNPIDAAPFLIAGGMGLQQRPQIAWNGQNWLVLYTSQVPEAGFFEDRLRAVRVSPAGSVLDAAPIVIPPTQFTPDTIGLQVAGLNGQWLLTRCVYHSDGYGTFLGGQRISGAGVLLDASPVMLSDWIYGPTRTLVANGEYLVVGPDWNESTTIKARRISANAQPIGVAFTVPSLNIATNGSDYYATWISGFVNLVGSRMTATGTLLTPAGTMLVPDFGQYNQASLSHDGTQWWLVWGAADQLRTIRISAAGAVLDAGGGVLMPIVIGGTNSNAYTPTLLPRTGGGVNLLWYDVRVALGYDTNVFALPISPANVPATERCLSTGTQNQRSSDLAAGPGCTSALAFISESANSRGVLVHLLDAVGNATTTEPIVVHNAPTMDRVGIAWNGSVYMIVWDEGAPGLTPTQIRMRRMNADGTFVDPAPVDVMPGFNPAVGALGQDFLIAGAKFRPTPLWIDLYGRRFDGVSGTFRDANPIVLASGYISGQPRVRSDESQWLIASHAMWSPNSSQGDAILTTLSAFGSPSAANNPTPYSGGTGDLDVAFSGSKHLLVWRMNTLSSADNSIAGRIMNQDGMLGNAFTIAQATGRQLRPIATWDGTTFIVAWEDQRNQAAFFDARTDIYATRVSETGVVLDAAAFPVFAGPQGDAGPSILSRGGATFIATSRFTTAAPFDGYRIGITRLGDAPICASCDYDFNQDENIDLTDAQQMAQVFVGLLVPDPAWLSGDLNADENADLTDAQILATFVVTGVCPL